MLASPSISLGWNTNVDAAGPPLLLCRQATPPVSFSSVPSSKLSSSSTSPTTHTRTGTPLFLSLASSAWPSLPTSTAPTFCPTGRTPSLRQISWPTLGSSFLFGAMPPRRLLRMSGPSGRTLAAGLACLWLSSSASFLPLRRRLVLML